MIDTSVRATSLKLLVSAATLVGLGCILSYLVAIACAIRSPAEGSWVYPQPTYATLVDGRKSYVYSSLGKDELVVNNSVYYPGSNSFGPLYPPPLRAAPRWASVSRVAAPLIANDPALELRFATMLGYGLPLRCVRVTRLGFDRPTAVGPTRSVSVLRGGRELLRTDDEVIYLPWGILPTRLLANGCFWAAMVATPFYASRLVVRHRRARSRACTGCGYPKTGIRPGHPCPECGRIDRQT